MSESPLLQTLAEAEAAYPAAARVIQEMYKLSPGALGSQIQYLIDRWGVNFWERAEYLSHLAESVGGKPAASIVEFTMEILRAQAMFMETRQYAQQDFETARREVYDNPEVMEGYYLEGLFLSHAFWPIHFDMHDYFLNSFLPLVPDEGEGVEIGFGHGLYLLEVLSVRKHTRARGFDISPYSLKYAGKILKAGGIDPERFDLGFADIRYPLEQPDNAFRWGVFAEILEHIPDPRAALEELRRLLVKGAPLFVTTVVDSNAMDHLYQFEDVKAIRQLMGEAGFRIVSEKVMRLPDYGKKESRDPTVDVALVAIPD